MLGWTKNLLAIDEIAKWIIETQKKEGKSWTEIVTICAKEMEIKPSLLWERVHLIYKKNQRL